jgi:Cu(I)/Ag(I) efflux system membrane fusion protein
MHPWIKANTPAKCTICGMDLVAVQPGDAVVPTGTVALSPSIVTTLGVETDVVALRPLARTLRVLGTIEDDDTRHRLITAWVEGRVEKLHANVVGVNVTAGAPLLEIYSPELQIAQREFVQLARAGELAATALPAARARLRKLGLGDPQLDELLRTGEPGLVTTVAAPTGGTIVKKDVYEGQWVKGGDKLLELADFSQMWFVFEVYEPDLAWLRTGQTVSISLRSLPGEVITAPIAFIDPNFNATTLTTKARAVLANPHLAADGTRHPLFHRVTAEGRVALDAPTVLTAPRSAVLDTGSGPVAYVEASTGRYETRALKLGRRGDTLVEVLAGLRAGEKVVTHGALLVDAQAQLAREAADTVLAGSTAPAGSEQLSSLANAAADAAAALAADNFPAYQTAFPRLIAASAAFPTLPRLEVGDALKAARRSFEPWSTAVADLLRPHGATLGVHVFQCPMAPVLGKGRWVQRDAALRNPFFGAAMASCGNELP